MKRRLAAGLAVLCALGACGDGGSDGPQTDPRSGGTGALDASGPEKVVYAGSNWYGHSATWAGVEQGIFRRAGFDVDVRAFGPSTDRINALEADVAQFASVGEVSMLMAMAAGRDQFYWIGSQDVAPGNEGLVAIGIDSVAGLKGKRIALNFNSSVHITVELLLRKAGLDPRRDVTLLDAKDSDVVNLVRSGNAEAGCIWEPFYSQLQDLPGANVLGTDMDTEIYERFKSMTGPDVIVCSRKWFDADPERARRLVHAYFEAVAWCRDHPQELHELIARRVNQPVKDVAAAMKNFKWLDLSAQRVVMSDARMFGQAEFASQVLIDMELTKSLPAFRNWTRLDVLRE